MRKLASSIIGALLATAAAAKAPEPSVLPLRLEAGNNFSLAGDIAGRPATFFFDSGWGVSAITPETATRVGCRPWGQMTGFRAIGERVDTQLCQPVTVRLGDVSIPLATVALEDLQKYMPPGSPTYAGAIGLDAFAGRTITIRSAARQIVIETPDSLRTRIAAATPIPIRLVRDARGAALTVAVGVPTARGMLWMELDTGNQGGTMVGRHAAALVGLDPAVAHGQTLAMPLAGRIVVKGPVQVLDLIMDGNIGADFLAHWDLTLDLATARGWLAPAS